MHTTPLPLRVEAYSRHKVLCQNQSLCPTMRKIKQSLIYWHRRIVKHKFCCRTLLFFLRVEMKLRLPKGLIKYSSNVRRKPGEAFSIQKQTETWVGLFSKYYKTRISRSGGPIRRASITSNGLIVHLTSRAAKSILKSRKGGNSSIAN